MEILKTLALSFLVLWGINSSTVSAIENYTNKNANKFRNASENVIRVSEKNPHYYSYKGKELLLLTSAEHYGAVIHSKFDYRKYLDVLASYGLNYTRIYPGSVALIPELRRKDDTLAPGPDFIAPWARSNTPGYIGGGNKFDLDRWDDQFFARLDDFLSYANEKDIIVEICFFNSQHWNTYPYSPLHQNANIQGVGCENFVEFETLFYKELVDAQLKYVEKIMVETNKFDNIIYEFVDEPTLDGTKRNDVFAWIDALITHADKIESQRPKKHLFAQQVMRGLDFCEDDRIAVIVAQYVTIMGKQIGGLPALYSCYDSNKPIEMNETVSALSIPNYYEKDVVASSRLESWEFIVGGGAAYNQLNACFTAPNPGGDHPDNYAILNNLRNLRSFVESMDFVKMKRDGGTIYSITPGGSVNGISEYGKQYAFYVHHSFHNYSKWHPSHYVPNEGKYKPVITLKLPEGDYLLTFINPVDLHVISTKRIKGTGENMTIECPEYKLDLAFKIIRVC